MNSFCVVCY